MRFISDLLRGLFTTIGGETGGSASSEFRVSLFTIIAASVLLGMGKIDTETWMIANGIASVGYSVSRGLAKKS